MIHPDDLDLEELERFERSHIGEVWQAKLIEMGARHTKVCQDRRAPVEDIRASQGALEAIYAVLGLAKTIRAEIMGRKKQHGTK